MGHPGTGLERPAYSQGPRCGGETGVCVTNKYHLSRKRLFHGRGLTTTGISIRVVVSPDLKCPISKTRTLFSLAVSFSSRTAHDHATLPGDRGYQGWEYQGCSRWLVFCRETGLVPRSASRCQMIARVERALRRVPQACAGAPAPPGAFRDRN